MLGNLFFDFVAALYFNLLYFHRYEDWFNLFIFQLDKKNSVGSHPKSLGNKLDQFMFDICG